MVEVTIGSKEDFEKAFRQFKMQCKREGVVREFRERQYYTKPSQRRRKKTKRKK